MQKTIKDDLLFFLLPALVVYTTGMAVSAWDLVKRQGGVYTFALQSVVGLALIVVGLGICFIAAGTLRRSYSATLQIREEHQLITHGIYRLVRHPIYLGASLVCIDVPIALSSVYGFLIMLALFPLILNRIRMEEKMLIEEFGDGYREYQATTSKLIPFVY